MVVIFQLFRSNRSRLTNVAGVNTGFGGSADTRTRAANKLKEDLLGGLQYGIFAQDGRADAGEYHLDIDRNGDLSRPMLPLKYDVTTIMPESWVRASMLVRLNSLAHGASGVTPSTIQTLLQLLNSNVTPKVPLYGSISASGDLSPLAYIAGALEGRPSVAVHTGVKGHDQRHTKRADVAMDQNSIKPAALTAREALALVNGTSVSAGVAALAAHEALNLAGLVQILSAMSVEALQGTDESFDPFIAAVRPHPGQKEASRNIYSMLRGSKLVDRHRGSHESSLRQDRYSIRTASQWLGPAIEDLSQAIGQITTELNSATDNPLIDDSTSPPRILHGGNFQAKAITSAVEKMRQSAQSMGRILFTQCTEMINPTTSQGLPPNLVVGNPSESFIFKGTDILIASLLSELGFLANPVASHVQTAEMGNQSVNSLALVSARYTLDALDIVCQLSAAHLVAVCQALDLRALQRRFLTRLSPDFRILIQQSLQDHLANPDAMYKLLEQCWQDFTDRLESTAGLDPAVRLPKAAFSLQMLIIPHLLPDAKNLQELTDCTLRLGQRALAVFLTVQEQYLRDGSAANLLGRGSKRMYLHIRRDLGIPLVGPNTLALSTHSERKQIGVTMGSLNGKVRAAMSSGSLYKVISECIHDVEKESQPRTAGSAKL
ncbi:MAG: hypothetical protein Q9174_001531 [Haloplaca sp. 1 TL-2023]